MIWATYLASWTRELGLPKLLGRFIQYENDDYDEKLGPTSRGEPNDGQDNSSGEIEADEGLKTNA